MVSQPARVEHWGSMTVFMNPSGLVAPPGPFSHVARCGDLVMLAGQTGVDADGRLVDGGIVAQAAQAMANIAIALASQGLGLEHIIKVTIYVTHAEDLDELVPYMDRAFPELFPGGFPASTLVVVQRLFAPEMRIEIEASAHA